MLRILRRAVVVAALAALLAATTSSAAVTVGTASPGGPMSGGVTGCFVAVTDTPVTCSIIMSTLPAVDWAPGGLSAPSSGVITRWRMSIGAFTNQTITVAPQVYSITGAGLNGRYTALRTGAFRPVPESGGALTFPERLAIGTNDRIGLSLTINGPAGSNPFVLSPTTNPSSAYFYAFTPALADGDFFLTNGLVSGISTRIVLNADVEPDIDFDGFGDETQDGCPQRADVSGACPPPVIGTPVYSKGSFIFTSDIAAKATTTLFRATAGRKVGKKCKAKATKGKRCTIYTKFAEWKDDVTPGSNTISYAYKVGGKTLKPGKYKATIVIVSAQNTSSTTDVKFTVTKPKKKK
ncbi:MAG: hypothetical protein HYX29_02830 [Solirubrobacterales bacterium]|nr:hypothetical protein [Solirubrobacterales bacterium]